MINFISVKKNIMLYEIIVDCRIANKDYKKGDIVSREEVEYFPSVMRPFSWKAPVETPVKAPEVEEPKEEKAEEPTEEAENSDVSDTNVGETEEDADEVEDEEVEEPKEIKSSKKSRSKRK